MKVRKESWGTSKRKSVWGQRTNRERGASGPPGAGRCNIARSGETVARLEITQTGTSLPDAPCDADAGTYLWHPLTPRWRQTPADTAKKGLFLKQTVDVSRPSVSQAGRSGTIAEVCPDRRPLIGTGGGRHSRSRRTTRRHFGDTCCTVVFFCLSQRTIVCFHN